MRTSNTEKNELKKIQKYRREKKNYSRVFVCLATVAVFITTMILTHTAKALTAQRFGDHHHTDGCYTEETILVCDLPEGEDHEHTAKCYEKERVLICDLAESDGEEIPEDFICPICKHPASDFEKVP